MREFVKFLGSQLPYDQPSEVVVKMGRAGACVATSDGEFVQAPALEVAVADVIGAGDSFVAGYLAARAYGVGDRVLWVDIPAGDVHLGTPRDGTVVPSAVHHVDTTVGAVAVAEDGALLVAGYQGVHLVPASGVATEVVRLIPEGGRRRLNDGKCGPDLTTLIVSTAIDDLSPAQLASWPGSGALFSADVDARGLPTNTWRKGTP